MRKLIRWYFFYQHWKQVHVKWFQVINYERDITKAKKGESDDLAYKKIAGFNEDLSGTVDKPDILQEDEVSDSEENSDDENEEKSMYIFF